MHTATGVEVTEEIKTEASRVPRQRREFFSLDDQSSELPLNPCFLITAVQMNLTSCKCDRIISAAWILHARHGGLPGR